MCKCVFSVCVFLIFVFVLLLFVCVSVFLVFVCEYLMPVKSWDEKHFPGLKDAMFTYSIGKLGELLEVGLVTIYSETK